MPAWANSSIRPYLKKTHHKNRAGGAAQGEGPEFKPQYRKNKSNNNNNKKPAGKILKEF
jgi:hypothetical protein